MLHVCGFLPRRACRESMTGQRFPAFRISPGPGAAGAMFRQPGDCRSRPMIAAIAGCRTASASACSRRSQRQGRRMGKHAARRPAWQREGGWQRSAVRMVDGPARSTVRPVIAAARSPSPRYGQPARRAVHDPLSRRVAAIRRWGFPMTGARAFSPALAARPRSGRGSGRPARSHGCAAPWPRPRRRRLGCAPPPRHVRRRTASSGCAP